MAGGP
ncbi:hypothetical protein YPPY94_3206, partial [Yersinia pestis PY-94]|jgi:hypothetical protein